MILFLAGLNMIPSELYQTAEIDGASSVKKFCYISFPLIIPTLFFVIVMSIINSFKTYREAFIIAGKHPQNEIYFLQHFLNNNFENLNYQRLAVATLLLFSIIFLFVGLLYWWQNRHTEDSLWRLHVLCIAVFTPCFFVFLSATVLFPAVYMIFNSFMLPSEITQYYATAMQYDGTYAMLHFIPDIFSLESFYQVFLAEAWLPHKILE